jgi:peptide/nickel transport system substrate-binding protein
MAELDYWMRWAQRRRSRRSAFGGLAATSAGLGLSGLLASACAGGRQSSAGNNSTGQAGTQTAAGKPVSGGVFNTFFNGNDVTNIDPQVVSFPTNDQICSAAMSRPFRFKTGTRPGPNPNLVNDGESEPDLALSAESPDAITWTIKLRPDAKFQNIAPVNGHAVEAEDIKATYVRALQIPTNPSRGALGMIDVNQISTPDKQTVVFKLNYPYAPFNKTLTSPIYSWIFPREALAGSYDPAKVMIGSGPFVLKSHTPDVEYVMTKNPDWFEKDRPYVDSVRFAIIPAIAQQLAQFTSGHLDEVVVLDGSNLATMKANNPKAQVLPIFPYNGGNNVYLPLGDPTSPFRDERVRQAMSMAIDRDAIHHAVYFDQFSDTLFVGAGLGKWALRISQLDADTAPYYKFDLNKAKQMLQASGILDQQFRWTFGNIESVAKNPLNGALLNMFGAAGLKLISVIVDYQKDYIDSGKGMRQGYFNKDTVIYGGQQSFTEVDETLFSYFHSKSTQNEQMVKDPALDAMIDKERTLLKEEDRLKAALDIQRYMAKKVYSLNGGGPTAFQFIQPRVQNYALATNMDGGVGTYAKLWLTQ